MATTKRRGRKTRASATSYLSQVSTVAKARPHAGVLFGPPGVGKTSIGAFIPYSVFLIDQGEQGIYDLKRAGLARKGCPVLPVAENYEMLLDILTELAAADTKYKWLIVDGITGMERLCFDYVCEKEFKGDWSNAGFHSYQQGYDITRRYYWPLFLTALDVVRDSGMNVMLLGHSEIKRFDDPEREGYDRHVVSMHPKNWSITHRWAEFVLFANYHVDIEKKAGAGKAKAKGGNERHIYTEYSALFDAKNRLGMPPVIEMGRSGKDAAKNLLEHF